MKAAGVPIVPGLEKPVESFDEIRAFAEEAGFPVMIKASAGGGGKGMRLVTSADELQPAYDRVRSEAASFFGDAAVYAEKFVQTPRHIEVQVLGDQQGNLIHLGERECTLQRRNQKVVEESPSPVVDAELRARLGETAVRAAAAVGYYSAGTIEFLMDAQRNFYFLEMNTRLQVEHPVTELVTGIDLVKQQLNIAQGQTLGLTQEDVRISGHAIECRIYAEDPTANFAPSPGLIRYLTLPEGPGIRNDNGVLAGYTVPISYDPMLSKLIAYGASREEARLRMRRALSEYRVDGIRTTISFYLSVMDNEAFRAGQFDTGFIDRMLPGMDLDSTAPADVEAAITAAAIFALEESEKVRVPQDRDSAWGRIGRLEAAGRSDA